MKQILRYAQNDDRTKSDKTNEGELALRRSRPLFFLVSWISFTKNSRSFRNCAHSLCFSLLRDYTTASPYGNPLGYTLFFPLLQKHSQDVFAVSSKSDTWAECTLPRKIILWIIFREAVKAVRLPWRHVYCESIKTKRKNNGYEKRKTSDMLNSLVERCWNKFSMTFNFLSPWIYFRVYIKRYFG